LGKKGGEEPIRPQKRKQFASHAAETPKARKLKELGLSENKHVMSEEHRAALRRNSFQGNAKKGAQHLAKIPFFDRLLWGGVFAEKIMQGSHHPKGAFIQLKSEKPVRKGNEPEGDIVN